MGDRSGGREPKGASLKKSKKNPGAPAAKLKKAAIVKDDHSKLYSLPPPLPSSAPYFDCAIALLSRQFDRDRDRVILRAVQEGNCCGLLTWFADVEKQAQVAELCKENSGICYFATGIHPDNVEKTNKKCHDDWIAKIHDLSCRPECIALLSGLNLSKEMGCHFAQESLLKELYKIACTVQLPLIVHAHDALSLEKVVELICTESNGLHSEEEKVYRPQIIVHNVIAVLSSAELAEKNPLDCIAPAISAGFYFTVSAAGIADDSSYTMAAQVLQRIPANRLLGCTDGPWRTPQNLADHYLRTQRNESANIPFVVEAIASLRGENLQTVIASLRANAMSVFSLDSYEASVAAATATAKNPTVVDEPQVEQEDTALVDDPAVEATAAASPGDGDALEAVHYRCMRCRKPLFESQNLISHDLSAASKTVFEVGDVGLCSAFLFVAQTAAQLQVDLVLKAEQGKDGVPRPSLSIGTSGLSLPSSSGMGGSVECRFCGLKVGKFSAAGDQLLCGCGAHVAGPVVRVQASKVDRDVQNFSLGVIESLAERSLQENELLSLEKEREEIAGKGKDGALGKPKKAKKLKSENRGNFSSYRNKSFIPNASRVANKGGEASVDKVIGGFADMEIDSETSGDDAS